MDKEVIQFMHHNMEPYLGKPIGIRHHYSGVWLGRFLGLGLAPHMLRIEGRRVWSWEGGRLEFSELCQSGCRSGDRLSVWTTQEIPIFPGDGLVELTFQLTEEVIENLKNL